MSRSRVERRHAQEIDEVRAAQREQARGALLRADDVVIGERPSVVAVGVGVDVADRVTRSGTEGAVWSARGHRAANPHQRRLLQRGGDVSRGVRLDGYAPEDLLVLDVLGSGRAQPLHDQVEALVLRWPDVVVIDRGAQRLARAGALRLERQDLAAAGQRDRGRRAAVDDPNHHGLSAAVLEILFDRVRERARLPEPAEHLLIVREAVEQDRLVDRAANGAPDKGSDRAGQTGDGLVRARALRYDEASNLRLRQSATPADGHRSTAFSSHSHDPDPAAPAVTVSALPTGCAAARLCV